MRQVVLEVGKMEMLREEYKYVLDLKGWRFSDRPQETRSTGHFLASARAPCSFFFFFFSVGRPAVTSRASYVHMDHTTHVLFGADERFPLHTNWRGEKKEKIG